MGLEVAAHIREDQKINSKNDHDDADGCEPRAEQTSARKCRYSTRTVQKPLSGKSLKQALQSALAQHLQSARQ